MNTEVDEPYRDDKKEKLYRRISFWISIVLSTAAVIWYSSTTPPDSPEMQKMRLFFKNNIMEVSEFIKLSREERKEYAAKKKHPFYKSYAQAPDKERDKIAALIHVSTDYTPYQYWFNLVFLWGICFTTLWFVGLMSEGAIILVRQSDAKRNKQNQMSE